MSKAFIKKFLLIIPGILLSLVLLEFSLRFAGWTIFSYQQYKNSKALRNKTQYTIMCLGESTTANNYPIQLEQILNEKYPGRFSIIDCGIPGTTLEIILDLLENNINQYKPDVAICMMGINNNLVTFNLKEETDNISYINKSKSINLKIFKLFFLLKKHLKLFLKNKLLFADNIDDYNWIQKYQYFRANKNYENAEKVLQTEIQKNPNNEHAMAELAYFYYFFLATKDKREIGMNMAKKALDKTVYNVIPKSMYYNIILNYCKDFNQDFNFYVDKIIAKDIDIFEGFYRFENYMLIKDFIDIEQQKKIANIIIKTNLQDTTYGFLAINTMEQKDYQKAQEYFDKVEELRLNSPNTETYSLYKLIIKKLIDNNIKVICMQYPIRSVNSLKEQLKNESYFDKITFISNEENFKKALMNKNYDEIFNDQFAGDFGHCTELGNTMIAENIVNTLENLINKKSDFKF